MGEMRNSLAERYRLQPMEVLVAHEMVDTSHEYGRSKRFVRVRLPDGMEYRTCDHLAILPRNPGSLVERVVDRLDPAPVSALKSGRRGLPAGQPMPTGQLLADYLEIQAPASQSAVSALARHARSDPERQELEALVALDRDRFRREVTERGRSLLDLLEQYPSCDLPFDEYLDLARPLRLRSYSISSSPRIRPEEADLMVSLLAEPHRARSALFQGVASHHLQGVGPGDVLHGRVIPCQESFRPPQDAPLIMISAGTGLAPFRAIIAERSLQPGAALLCYFGCRHPDIDFLHRDELEAAHSAGVVDLRPTFSRAPVDDLRYVQDRIVREGDEVWQLLEAGAHVRVCGDGQRMAPDVRAAFRTLFREQTGGSAEEAAAWLQDLVVADRYVEDVWLG